MTYDEAKVIARLVRSKATEQAGHDESAIALEMAVMALLDPSVMTALFILAKVLPATQRSALHSVPNRKTT